MTPRFADLRGKELQTALKARLASLVLHGSWSWPEGVLVLALAALLTLLIAPPFASSPPFLRVGDVATKDIRSHRDFLVEDAAATEQKRLEALAAVDPVFDGDAEMGASLGKRLQEAFGAAARALASGKKGGKAPSGAKEPPLPAGGVRAILEEGLGISVTEEEYRILQRNRFAPELAAKLSSTLAGLYRGTWIVDHALSRPVLEAGLVVRDLRSQTEERLQDLDEVVPLAAAEGRLLEEAGTLLSRERPDVRRLARSLLPRLLQPNLTFHRQETERRRQAAARETKPVLYLVKRNEMILRGGERVTPDHVHKIAALYREGGPNKGLAAGTRYTGLLILLLLLSAGAWRIVRPWLEKDSGPWRKALFLPLAAVLQVALAKGGIVLSGGLSLAFPALSEEALYYAIPLSAGAMLAAALLGRNVALVFAVYCAILSFLLFPALPDMFLFSLYGGLVAAFLTERCEKRSAFFRAGLFLGAVNAAVILCASLLSGPFTTMDLLAKASLGLGGGVAAGILVAGSSPLFENLFDVTTDMRLLELANLNQPVLQRMSVETPGTYHHSVLMASLAEAAAKAIGAHALLARVSAYYHDMGKLKKPLYFIENQPSSRNPHDKLSPRMSSRVIISHVRDGCDLAREARLGADITAIIRQHHGTTLVRFFYDKARQKPSPVAGQILDSDFRYPGPKPQTREAGLVLLADVVEAASRCLTDPTPSRIRNLVRDRIRDVFLDGQLDECKLTLHDLNRIAESFTRGLLGIFHHRIAYGAADAQLLSIKNIHEGRSRKPAARDQA